MCAMAQSMIEPHWAELGGVAARWCLVVWSAHYSPPALVASKTGGSRRRHGAAVPSGLRKCLKSLVETCGAK